MRWGCAVWCSREPWCRRARHPLRFSSLPSFLLQLPDTPQSCAFISTCVSSALSYNSSSPLPSALSNPGTQQTPRNPPCCPSSSAAAEHRKERSNESQSNEQHASQHSVPRNVVVAGSRAGRRRGPPRLLVQWQERRRREGAAAARAPRRALGSRHALRSAAAPRAETHSGGLSGLPSSPVRSACAVADHCR